MYPILLSEEAKQDFFSAYDWYESVLFGLGEAFQLSIEASLNQISRNPKLFQKKYKKIKVCYIDRFPYGIHYLVEKKTIKVQGIFHTSKSPTNWDKRLG